ncbi:hypothetical protein DY000_02006053 [Brassica cretica]|uniref:Uncharacterized protein n=1 Tax=Brassica cretica TaxID=69181 RepID=A0ABQ7CF07_BRACR|nr:hypothetical protein DY000_02006053 [Brassica cretica]
MWKLLQLRRRRLMTPRWRLLELCVFDGSVRLDEISIVDEALRWLCYGDEGGGCDFEINLCTGGLVIRMRSQFGRGMLSVGRIFGVGGM